jgi:translation initiation factor IF-3
MSKSAALARAIADGLDLIEISPNANPPVAKIMDFGKYQYLENKKTKAAVGKTIRTETKSIQVKIGTGDHDLEIKAGKVSEFLREGHRVKVELFLPGRSKYLDPKFLETRLERLLKFVSEAYRIADPPKKGPKGLTAVIERDK